MKSKVNEQLSEIRELSAEEPIHRAKRFSKQLQQGVEALATMQEVLYAQDRWPVLLIFQAMDAAGKDGAIRHVMSGVNPQGCQVTSFKSPSAEELDHDYLWRCMKSLPERGRIGIFNRSYSVCKFFLNVSKKEQKRRFLDRIEGPDKQWKFSAADIRERKYWASKGQVVELSRVKEELMSDD